MKQLSKRLVLALMIPVILMPNMTKAALPSQTLVGIKLPTTLTKTIPDYLETKPEIIDTSNNTELDPQTAVDQAENNYIVTFSPEPSEGIFTFNHSDKKNFAIVLDEKDPDLSQILSVSAKIMDSNGDLDSSYTFSSAYGQFSKILDLSTLNVDETYTVEVNLTSKTLLTTMPINFSEKKTVVTLKGEGSTTEEENNNDGTETVTATDNYHATVSPAPINGVYEFNSSSIPSTITITEADYSSALEITKVKFVLTNDDLNFVESVKTVSTRTASGFFMNSFDLASLDLNAHYTASVIITYLNTESELSSTKTYDLVQYVGESEDSITNEETDNYTVTINKDTTTSNGGKVYYYKSTDSDLQVLITEEDRSASAINEIVRVKYYIRNTDEDNALFAKTDLNSPNASGYYVLTMDPGALNEAQRYQIDVYVTYLDTDDANHYYTKMYSVLKLVPKTETNDDYTPSDLDNVSYNINKSLVNYEGANIYLYGKNDLTNINTYQSTYGSYAPQVTSMTYLMDGSSIKNCEDANSCTLQYELPLDDEVNLSVRVNYEYYDNYADRYHRYSKIYDLGRHLRVDDDSADTDNNSDNDSDTILTVNDFILIKGTSSSVYLVNKYNNRFYIPDWSVLKSWFYQPNIVQVNDSQLSQYTLKDNLIYRPGSLIKIATDPKCYAVDLNGKLRWVYNETVARAIYGTNWNKNIFIVPDALFPSYSFGADIYSADDYDMPSLSDALQMYNK